MASEPVGPVSSLRQVSVFGKGALGLGNGQAAFSAGGSRQSSLSSAEIKQLKTLIGIAEKVISNAEPPKRGRPKGSSKEALAPRTRRTGKELVAFRTMLKSERKKRVPVPELAKAHGVTKSYIYQMK